VEEERVEMARDTMEAAGEKLVLPVDCVVADAIEEGVETRVTERASVADGDRIGDIGPATREAFRHTLAEAGTVVWNGPMGVFEVDAFAGGTVAVAKAAAEAADGGAVVVLGGGDSAAAAREAGVADRLTHVSTGGGASLEFLAGNELPGVAALDEAGTSTHEQSEE
jgi:3-phosphoglycerate kinase